MTRWRKARDCSPAASLLTNLARSFFAPTILADVTHEMDVMREETFGPVLPVAAFDSDDARRALANDSEFGLAASVWTPEPRRGEAWLGGSCRNRDGERRGCLLRHQ